MLSAAQYSRYSSNCKTIKKQKQKTHELVNATLKKATTHNEHRIAHRIAQRASHSSHARYCFANGANRANKLGKQGKQINHCNHCNHCNQSKCKTNKILACKYLRKSPAASCSGKPADKVCTRTHCKSTRHVKKENTNKQKTSAQTKQQ